MAKQQELFDQLRQEYASGAAKPIKYFVEMPIVRNEGSRYR
jgi:hypothetical protein